MTRRAVLGLLEVLLAPAVVRYPGRDVALDYARVVRYVQRHYVLAGGREPDRFADLDDPDDLDPAPDVVEIRMSVDGGTVLYSNRVRVRGPIEEEGEDA